MTLSEFEQFCLRHQEGMFSMAHQVLCNVQSSEDAVLEAMTRMYKGYRHVSFHTQEDASVYALMVARSVANEFKKRLDSLNPESDDHSPIPFPSPAQAPTSGESTPECTAARFLDSLSSEEKTALRLHAMGLAYESIAAALDLSPVAVRALIHLARTSLQDRLTEEGFPLE